MDNLYHVLQSRRDERYSFCKHEGGECTVEASVYGYRPNLAANIIFTAIFGLSMFIHAFQGVKWRCWTFFGFMVIGTFGEAVGASLKIPLFYPCLTPSPKVSRVLMVERLMVKYMNRLRWPHTPS